MSDPEARLASWKEIADYLGRSPRTVQRWLADYGLPVHRLGGSSGPIFAYKDELSAWLRNRGHADDFMPMTQPSMPAALGPVALDGHTTESSICDFNAAPGFLKGRSAELSSLGHGMWETLSSADFSTSVRVFRDAIDLDPGNARALAGLSFVLLTGGLLNSLNPSVYTVSAEDALRRAIEIDPDLLQVRTARAWLKVAVQRNWKAARRGFKDILARNSLFGPALVGQALLLIAEGCLAEASDLLLEASTQSPLSAPTLLFRAWNAYLGGRSATARGLLAQARMIGHSGTVMDALEALALIDRENPEASLQPILLLADQPAPHPLLLGALGYCHAAAGQTREAEAILHRFMHARTQGREDCSYPLALTFIGLNDRSNAVRWLKQAYADGSLWSLGFKSDPMLAPLHNDSLFLASINNLSYPSPEDTTSRLASAS
ncbi:MAG: helix-turn-helix domain-containing protein [Acidocella sp.]|nr:helix-turn-helix domain-containing protein [Acidocella sp.]